MASKHRSLPSLRGLSNVAMPFRQRSKREVHKFQRVPVLHPFTGVRMMLTAEQPAQLFKDLTHATPDQFENAGAYRDTCTSSRDWHSTGPINGRHGHSSPHSSTWISTAPSARAHIDYGQPGYGAPFGYGPGKWIWVVGWFSSSARTEDKFDFWFWMKLWQCGSCKTLTWRMKVLDLRCEVLLEGFHVKRSAEFFICFLMEACKHVRKHPVRSIALVVWLHDCVL